jgi:hypothetical protein
VKRRDAERERERGERERLWEGKGRNQKRADDERLLTR